MAFEWLNEPPHWSEQDGTLAVTTGADTDFWCRTFYGFIHDNGHFRHTGALGDFTASVRISADYQHLYDQAGLMLRVDSSNWMKCGIEYTDGAMHFSTVVTRGGYSDWSQLKLPDAAHQDFGVRVTRHAEALRVQYQLSGGNWAMARLAMLPMALQTRVGMMCCSPQRHGLVVNFEDFRMGPPMPRELHD